MSDIHATGVDENVEEDVSVIAKTRPRILSLEEIRISLNPPDSRP
jgi:hypothetical protein